jgi:hypothetical protein
MKFFLFIEFAAAIIIAVIIISQILIPTLKGTRWWSMFRKEGELEDEIIKVNQQIAEKKLEEKLQTKKRELEKE